MFYFKRDSQALPGSDLTEGHSCSGRQGPWEAGPWRPPGLGGSGRLNVCLKLQSPACNLNWFYDLFKLETSTLIQRSVLSQF